MKRFALLMSIVCMGAVGCATAPVAGPDIDGASEAIVYETSPGPWCGRCDTVKLTLVQDGRIWIERRWAGSYGRWRTQTRFVQSSPETFIRFRDQLAPYRPSGVLWLRDLGPGCSTFVADGAEVRINWRGDDDSELWFAYGCEGHADMQAAVSNATKALGLGNLPGVY